MPRSCLLIAILIVLLITTGCQTGPLARLPQPRIPFVHRIDIQQGNVVTQEMVGQLRVGMNKKKVRFLMGTPIIQDTFHSSRWDYIYTFKEGGGGSERRLITAVFNEDGKLITVEGDIKAALGKLVVDRHQDTSVNVPGEYEKGLLDKLKDSMPFTGDEEAEEIVSDAKDTAEDVKDDVENEAEEAADEALVAAADADSVSVPEGAVPKKKKGFFKRLVDSVGLGPDEEDDENTEPDLDVDPDDRRYRDPTNPETNPDSQR